MELRIIGGTTSTKPRMVHRIIELCESLPDGEGLTTRELAARLGVTDNGVSQHAAHDALTPYKITGYKTGAGIRGNVWANERTVKEHYADQDSEASA